MLKIKEDLFMDGATTCGTQRIKMAKVEVKGVEVFRLLEDALINNGYDIDIEPINDDYQGAQGQRIYVYHRLYR